MAKPTDDTVPSQTKKEDHASKVPMYKFPDTLEKQREELKDNPLMRRFAKSREELSVDRHRPHYHFASPEGHGDPNGLCHWNGYYHLFYQAWPHEDPRQHWGHAISTDLIHWEDLPYAIYPGPESRCNSGSTLVEDDRVIMMYGGSDAGEMVAVSDDPLLLNWDKLTGSAVIRDDLGDPCIFSHGGVYYCISGGIGTYQPGPGNKPLRLNHLLRSDNLTDWEYLHPFVEGDCYSLVGDDGACPYFWPIGNRGRYILLNHSHISGSRYLIGDYDADRSKFVVTNGGSFNRGPVGPSGIHAPSAMPDGEGGVYCIFNMNGSVFRPTWFLLKNQSMPDYWQESSRGGIWTSVMTMPVRLTVDDDDYLYISPAGDYESLRGDQQRVPEMVLPANEEIVLESISGDALEIKATIDPLRSSLVELSVLRSPDRREYTRILYYKDRGYRTYSTRPGTLPVTSVVCLDNSRSSLSPDVNARVPETAYVRLEKGEPVELHIFIDRSIVEVFVNGRQYVAELVHPSLKESVGVSIRAQGQDAVLRSLDAWQMVSLYHDKG